MEYLKKHDKCLSFEMDCYFECENFWGDFENNLAFLSQEMVMESIDKILHMYITTFEDDDDFSYADYFAAIKMGTQVIPDMIDKLPEKWIWTLHPQAGKK